MRLALPAAGQNKVGMQELMWLRALSMGIAEILLCVACSGHTKVPFGDGLCPVLLIRRYPGPKRLTLGKVILHIKQTL